MLKWMCRLVCDPIATISVREMCWTNGKVRVKQAPIKVIDRRAVFRSRDFWPWEKRRPMEFRSTRFFFTTMDEPIGVWSNRVICWPNEKVRVNPAPIKVIDRRAVFRSRDFRPMREKKTDGVPVNEFLAWACGFDVQCTIPRACQVLPV